MLLSFALHLKGLLGQTWDSGLRSHLFHGRLAIVYMNRRLRIGFVVCRVLLDFSSTVRSIIWTLRAIYARLERRRFPERLDRVGFLLDHESRPAVSPALQGE